MSGLVAGEARVSVHLESSAATGRVLRITETGFEARLAEVLPRDRRLRVTLHLRHASLGAEAVVLRQDGDVCAFQFVALRPADRENLLPLMDPRE
jgi:hypothetical protein